MLLFWGVELVQGALLYLYVQSALHPDFRLQLKHTLHFTPYLLLVALLFYYQYFTGNTIQISNGYVIFKDGAPLIMLAIGWLYKAYTVVYLMFGLYEINVESRMRKLFYADPEKVKIDWLRKFILGSLCGYLIMYLSIPNFLGLKQLTDMQIAAISSVVSVFFVFYAGYVNYRQQFDVNDQLSSIEMLRADSSAEVDSSNRYRRTGLSEEIGNEILRNLLVYMEEKRPYSNSNLTLSDLSKELQVSTNHLSQVINEKLKKNFFTFINEYRIKEFERRIQLGLQDNYTLIGIALDCGFSSKSSFYSVFKKLKRSTPTEYIRKLRKTENKFSAV